MSHGEDTSYYVGRRVGREDHAQRSAPPVSYAYATASQDPPDPPDPNKKDFGNNPKTPPPKSDYPNIPPTSGANNVRR
jgi:hypothetical protein